MSLSLWAVICRSSLPLAGLFVGLAFLCRHGDPRGEPLAAPGLQCPARPRVRGRAATIAVIAGITLFYYSNGADQIATQRYVLDWLPILMVLMVRGERPPVFAGRPLLVTWGADCEPEAKVMSRWPR